MTDLPPDPDARSTSRQLARSAVSAALLSCSATCVVNWLATKTALALGGLESIANGCSLLLIVIGIGLGLAGLIGGLRRKSLDTSIIAGIGLTLNLGIVFVIVWYYTVIRPGMIGR